jgi:hypothetical protein
MFRIGAKTKMRAKTRLDRLWKSESEAGPIEGFKAKRAAVGALAIGAQAVGALALGALAIGTLAVGRLLIKRLAVRRARVHSFAIDELDVKRLRVGEFVITDRITTPSTESVEAIAPSI